MKKIVMTAVMSTILLTACNDEPQVTQISNDPSLELITFVDVNKNGVRDDVEEYIKGAHADDGFEPAMRLAKSIQVGMDTDKSDAGALETNYNEYLLAAVCLHKVKKIGPGNNPMTNLFVEDITEETVNTPSRKQQYSDFVFAAPTDIGFETQDEKDCG